ncbi:MAG: hypothetical protein WAP55_01740 [Minisyncoccia bacterium]
MPAILRENLDNRIKDASKVLGVDKKELIERAVAFYLDSVQKTMELKEELEAWDMLSNEVLELSEKSISRKM